MATVIKKHVNKHGKLVECGATTRKCRYASDSHTYYRLNPDGELNRISSPEEVFEKMERKSKVQTITNDVNNVRQTIYDIPSHRIDEAIKSIDKANRKLEKQGFGGQYSYEIETFIETGNDGLNYEMNKLTLTKPEIIENGWKFIARVDEDEDDDGNPIFITRSVGSDNLAGEYEVKGSYCDQCKTNRKRHKTYVLKDENGEYKQVGSGCLEGFLGIKPKGLWAIESDINLAKEDGEKRYSLENAVLPTEEIIAMGLAVSNGGKQYVSGMAENGDESTRSQVYKAFFNPLLSSQEADNFHQYIPLAKQILKEVKFNDTSDYGRNMNLLLAKGWNKPRNIGYIVSSIPAYMRAKHKENQKPKVLAKGFLGAKGDKLQNIPAKVERVSDFTSTYGYRTVSGRMIIMRTPDNKLIKWTTSSNDETVNNLEAGNEINIDRLIIKGEDNFAGEDQTEIKNAKISLNKK